jgi:branched-chain amino acid aminotransferase
MLMGWHNGAYCPRDQIRIHPADYGFARGVALFELGRVYHGRPFYLEAHLERLRHGAEFLGIPLNYSIADLAQIAEGVIARNHLPQSAIKFYLTMGQCGTSSPNYAACADFSPQLMVLEDPVTQHHPEAPYGLEAYRRGQRLKIVPLERDMPMVKSTNYLAGFYAARQLAGTDWDDILFTHRDGFITEATKSNFFCAIDGVLVTPQRGMLLGITRHIVLQLAKQLGISTAERDLFPHELAEATEAFTTGSIAELVPASRIDDHILSTTMEGPVFKQLRKAFTAHIQNFIS